MPDPRPDEFEALSALIAELRGRLPSDMSPRQYEDVGLYMLKALWLGRGEPLELVFESHRPRPSLHVVS